MTAKAIFELNASLRHDQGKGASRRLRRNHDQIPAILYGGNEPPQTISLDQKKVMHALANPGFFSHILTLHLEGKKQQVVLKDVQRHHFKKAVAHMDFQRIKASDLIHMHVPLRYLGEATCPGVKDGGIVSHHLIDVEVRCRADALPEFIEVDISNMELDQGLHLSDLKIPKGVELSALAHGHGPEHNHSVVSIHLPRIIEEPAPVVEETAETEVIPKGKEAAAGAAGGSAATGTSASGASSTAGGGQQGDKSKK